MSRAVLISIKPEWCAKIISGRKTIEVRKKDLTWRRRLNLIFTAPKE